MNSVIDSTIDGTLSPGAIPVVVLFAVGPHMQIRRISMPGVRLLLIHAISPEQGDDTSLFPFKVLLKVRSWLCFLLFLFSYLFFSSNLLLSPGVDRAQPTSLQMEFCSNRIMELKLSLCVSFRSLVYAWTIISSHAISTICHEPL